MEMAWRNESVDVESWVKQYAMRRYGAISDPSVATNLQMAWSILHKCCYIHDFSWSFKSRVETAPAITMGSSDWDTFPNTTSMLEALKLLLSGHDLRKMDKVGPYLYDVVDITRQAITNLFSDVQEMFGLAYQKWQFRNENSTVEFTHIVDAMLEMINDLDKLLASNENFLLGKWIEGARNSVRREARDLYEFNACNQITMWGYHENIEDYASKQWAGLVGDYYMRRWKLFTGLMLECLTNGSHLDFTAYENARYDLENEWGMEHKDYPSKPTGRSLDIAFDLYEKYITVQGSQVTYKEVQESEFDVKGHYICLFGTNYKPWTRSINQLMYLCDINPTCVGFTSSGMVYNGTGSMVKSPTVTLYLKQT